MNKQDKEWVLFVYWLMYVSIPPELSAYNKCIKFVNLKSVVELMVDVWVVGMEAVGLSGLIF